MNSPTELDLLEHRRQFAALSTGVYLNFGARGAMSDSAVQAIVSMMQKMQRAGPASRGTAAMIKRETNLVHEAFAAVVGVTADRIAILQNVSTACATALWGRDWRPGQHALIGSHEPVGTWIAALHAAQRCGFEVAEMDVANVQNKDVWCQRLETLLKPTTGLVLLSHVDFVTGSAIPLKKLTGIIRNGPCPEATIAIDGSQAVGAIEVDLENIDLDLYAIAGQKWLGGPDGISAIAVSARASRRLVPSIIGWRAVIPTADGIDITLAPDSARFETGTAAYSLYPGLREALRCADEFAPMEVRAARVRRGARRLRDSLTLIPRLRLMYDAGLHGLTSFTIEDMSAEAVVRELEMRGIVAKALTYPACVRVSIHYLTLDAEIDALCEAITEILRS